MRGTAERVDVELISGNTFRGPWHRSDARSCLDSGRRPHAGRASGRGNQLQLLAAPVRRFAGSAQSGCHRQQHADHDRRRRAAGLCRSARDRDARSLHAADDEGAGDAHVGRPRQPAQPLGVGDRTVEAGAHCGHGKATARRALSADQRIRAAGGAGVRVGHADVQGALSRQAADIASGEPRAVGPPRRRRRRRSSC